MTREEKREHIRRAQSDAEAAKSRLISILYELEEIDAKRAAGRLEKIICELEAWQNSRL